MIGDGNLQTINYYNVKIFEYEIEGKCLRDEKNFTYMVNVKKFLKMQLLYSNEMIYLGKFYYNFREIEISEETLILDECNINKRKLKELDRPETKETKKEIERERKESKRKVIEVFYYESIYDHEVGKYFTNYDSALNDAMKSFKYLMRMKFKTENELIKYCESIIRKITYNCVE